MKDKQFVEVWLMDICADLSIQYDAEDIGRLASMCLDPQKRFDITQFHTCLASVLATRLYSY